MIAQVCLLALARPQIAEAAEPQEKPSTQLVHPKLTNEVSLSYPRELLEQTPRPEGQVVVKYVVGVDGVPKEIEVTTPVHPTLDALAIAAVADLRYTPATYGGQPVEVVLSIGIEIAVPAPEPETEPEPEAEPANGEEPSQVEETGPVRLAGMLLEAGRRTPVVGAVILAVPAEGDPPVGKIRRKRYGAEQTSPAWSVRAVSDETGGFELRGLPAGKVRFVVLTQGFERLEFIEEITATARVEVTYFQERLVANPYRTVVASKRDEPEEVTRRTISVDEINNLPGTQGDALKSIQNFPGIARAPLGIGLLVIRGSAPSDSNTYLGYHKIPQLFHFGALSSVFNSDMLAQIDFIPGNFDSRFGDSIGGVVNVVPRKGRRDGFHGYIDADVFDVGALVEGPVGEGSYALSARRSYIDAVLGVALPEDIGLGFVQAPRYWDYQGLFDYPLGGGELSLRAFGSDDQVSLVTEDANESATDERNEFGTRILFHRADIVYRKQEGPWDFLITPSYRYQEANGGALGIFEFSLIQHEFSGRAEFGYRMSRRAALRVGTEVGAGTSIIDARAPSF
ncbi:MAG: energy transducer TonB, partial [Nannocystaceae bacterium]